jgi:hypothetical protein
MNSEILHPEIKDMAKNETFVEYVYVTKPSGMVRVNTNKIILISNVEEYLKELGVQYGGDVTNLVRYSK